MKMEYCGQIEPVLQRLSPHAEYVIYGTNPTQATVITGVEAIRSQFYEKVRRTHHCLVEYEVTRLAVDDGVVITQGRKRCAYRGSALVAAGVAADPDGFYLSCGESLVIWPFDVAGRPIGETIFYGYDTPLAEVAGQPMSLDQIEEWHEIPVPPQLQDQRDSR